jgi:hypothetical protein
MGTLLCVVMGLSAFLVTRLLWPRWPGATGGILLVPVAIIVAAIVGAPFYWYYDEMRGFIPDPLAYFLDLSLWTDGDQDILWSYFLGGLPFSLAASLIGLLEVWRRKANSR